MQTKSRLQIVFEIDQTLDQYCHACPYGRQQRVHRNCKLCPINGRLREYGQALDDIARSKRSKSELESIVRNYTAYEDHFILKSVDNKSLEEISDTLDREVISIQRRLAILKKKGVTA